MRNDADVEPIWVQQSLNPDGFNQGFLLATEEAAELVNGGCAVVVLVLFSLLADVGSHLLHCFCFLFYFLFCLSLWV